MAAHLSYSLSLRGINICVPKCFKLIINNVLHNFLNSDLNFNKKNWESERMRGLSEVVQTVPPVIYHTMTAMSESVYCLLLSSSLHSGGAQ